jgi:retron-type reverse transcriptase
MRTERTLRRLRDWAVPEPLRELIRRWLAAGVWNAPVGAQAGTSQGGVISPLLCNIYLHSFDCALNNYGGKDPRKRVWLVRYADDFVLLARDESAIRRAAERSAAELRALDLTIHPQKSRITTFDHGFQFVGWFFVRDEKFQLR